MNKPTKISDEQLLNIIQEHAFRFFWYKANTDPESPGYGLIRDRYPDSPYVCNIASVGFGLTGLCIAVERGWITKEEAYNRALGTIRTLKTNAESNHGFFYRFLDMNTAKKNLIWHSELSSIDTALLIAGTLICGQYFGNEVAEKAMQLYEKVNWPWFLDLREGGFHNQFHLGWIPDDDKENEIDCFVGHWDWYAEQLIMYFIAVGSPSHPVDNSVFYSFHRQEGKYGDQPSIIHSWFGSLFTYQYAHAWIDFRNKVDRQGYNWLDNSVYATLANRQYCIDNASKFKTYSVELWGLTSCDGPWGYKTYGSFPSGVKGEVGHFDDGTVASSGAAGSIVFTPDESMDVIRNLYNNFPGIWGEYGFLSGINILENGEVWYAHNYVGIELGIMLVMIENFRTSMIWDIFMQIPYVQEGMKKTGFRDIK